MTATKQPVHKRGHKLSSAARTQLEGIQLLIGIVGLMWIVEVINWADHYKLRYDGIYSRNFDRLWGIFTSPFIHENFAPHLLDNTIPLLFMGVIIALRGAARLGLVTVIVIVLGGLGTWIVGPANTSTIGASGLVFGYATYLFARGFFNRNLLELLTGAVVGIVWGGVLVSSIVPHTGVSWQGHVCGAVAGVIAAWLMSEHRPGQRRHADKRAGADKPAAAALAK